MPWKWIVVFFFLSFSTLKLNAQVQVYEDFIPKPQFIYTRSNVYYAYIHTGGIGLGFEHGRYSQHFRYSAWSVEFSTIRHPKNIRVEPYGAYFGRARAYVNGKINDFWNLRAGYGSKANLNEKPFWGGVNVSIEYAGGFSLGFTLPQYLYIFYQHTDPQTGETYLTRELERMDPNNPKHLSWSDVYGNGPFLHGFFKMRPYPGIYAKLALNFEFGRRQDKISSLEAGLLFDFYFMPIPLMALNPTPPGFLNLYLSYRFGKRYGIR